MPQKAVCVPAWRFLYHVITILQRAHSHLTLIRTDYEHLHGDINILEWHPRSCRRCHYFPLKGRLCSCPDNNWTEMQRWRSGESTRLPPMWPGFDSQTRRHMWVEFVGSLLCTERFSPGTPVSPLLKNRHLTWVVLIVNFNLQCSQLVLQG